MLRDAVQGRSRARFHLFLHSSFTPVCVLRAPRAGVVLISGGVLTGVELVVCMAVGVVMEGTVDLFLCVVL